VPNKPGDKLYYFSIQNPKAEAATYSCTANSVEQAFRSASFVGYKDALLLEQRELQGYELPSVGRAAVAANPLVGEEWLPLVDMMALHLELQIINRYWIMNVFPHEEPFARDCPYVQTMLLPEGDLYLECGPTNFLRERDESGAELAEWLGWSPPLDEKSPNYSVKFPPGTCTEYVAGAAIQALTVLFGVSTKDGFSLSRGFRSIDDVVPGIEELDPQEEYVLVQKVFGLTGKQTVQFPTTEVFREKYAL